MNQINDFENIFDFEHFYIQKNLNVNLTFIINFSFFRFFDKYTIIIEKNDIDSKIFVIKNKYQNFFNNFCSKKIKNKIIFENDEKKMTKTMTKKIEN